MGECCFPILYVWIFSCAVLRTVCSPVLLDSIIIESSKEAPNFGRFRRVSNVIRSISPESDVLDDMLTTLWNTLQASKNLGIDVHGV